MPPRRLLLMLHSLRRLFVPLLLAFVAVGAHPTAAQPVDVLPDRFAFDADLAYDDAVPTPESVLGYEIGTHFTLYADVVRYLHAVADASDRVTMQPYGTTYEGRTLYYLVFTAPANHENLDAIKEGNQRLATPGSLSDAERQDLMQNHPLTVSYSYTIHGNEGSSTEAAMRVAYRLAAATDAETQSLLDDVVFVMYPTVNPDGRDRYAYWQRSMNRNLVATDPDDISHDEPWPQGRTNHYWFDLNRDWIWTVHPEMDGLIDVYQQFMPQVHVDYHEQGYEDNYFTMPGTTPRNGLLPDPYVALADTFGRANVDAFDRVGAAYFTREAFDFFYPSYGSSYPSVMGAIGMLTEQAGIGGGRAIENEDGYVLTLRQRAFNHYLTSIASLKAAQRNRSRLMTYFTDALSQETNTVDTEAYLFPDDGGTGYLTDLLEVLDTHNIAVERATESFRASDAMDYRTGERSTRTFERGTYLVRTDQPRHLFINTLLQRRVAFDDSVMYDMSTWSAPLAYNLDAYSTRQAPNVATESVEDAPAPPVGVLNPDARYAYVIDWNQRYAPTALSLLWERGYRVRAAHEPFSTGRRTFPAGSLVVLLGRNYEKDNPTRDMQSIAREAGVRIVGLDTGRMDDGPDLGSENHAVLEQPEVAMLVDQPFSTYTSGQIWYLFDQETRLPVTRIRASSLQESDTGDGRYVRYGKASLDAHDVLILPNGYALEAVFGDGEALMDWVERGGTVVAAENSAAYFTQEGAELTGVEMVEDTTDVVGPYTAYGDRSDAYGLDGIPGAALTGRIDTTHPLAFGLGEDLYTLKYGSDAMVASPDLQTAGHYARDADDLLVSGYASQKNLQKLAGGSFAATVERGEGRIVFLLDNTQYRMFWRGPSRMMQNAVMLVPALVD